MPSTEPTGGSEDALLDRLDRASVAVHHASAAVSRQGDDAALLEAVRVVASLRTRVEALYLDVVREVDQRGAATSSPVATTVQGFLRTTTLLGAGQARRDVSAARATAPDRPLRPFAEAMSEGRGSRAHLDVAVRCLDRVPRHLLDDPQASRTTADFLELAATDASPLEMDRAGQQLLARLDPDGTERFDPLAHERRLLDVHTDSTGMVVGRFQLDATAGAALRTALVHFSAPSPGADGVRDPREARQRRADALADIVDRALGTTTPRRGERPRVVVHATPEQLIGTSAGLAIVEGLGPVSTGTAQRLSCDAVVQRLVVSPSLGPLDVGRAQRLATPAVRTALEGRDGGCVVPGCGVAPSHCDAHHVTHWADGGPTSLANMCLMCPGHHTAVHSGTWQVRVVDGRVEVVPPRWVDPARRPRPVRHHLVERVLSDLDAATGPGTDDDSPIGLGPPPDRRPEPAPGPDVDLGPRPPSRPTPPPGPDIDLGPPPEASPPARAGEPDIDLGPPPEASPTQPGGSARVDLSMSPVCELLAGMLHRQHSFSVWERRRAMATVQP